MKTRTPRRAPVRASTETYERQYSADPQVHQDSIESEVETPESRGDAPLAITRKPVELRPEQEAADLGAPLKYVVSAPDAVEKAEVLLEKVKEARPDLAQEVDEVLQGVDGLEQKVMGPGFAEHEAAEAGLPEEQPAPGAAPAAGQAPAALEPGTRVKVKTKDAEYSGVVEAVNDDGTLEVLTDNSMKLSRVPAESVAAEPQGQAEAMSLPTGLKSSRRPTVEQNAKLKAGRKRVATRMRAAGAVASEVLVNQEIDTAQKELDMAKEVSESARRNFRKGNRPAASTLLDHARVASGEASRTLETAKADVEAKASPDKAMGAGVAAGAGRKPAPAGRVKVNGDLRRAVAEETGTRAGDWEDMDGPETGVGVERWFRNKKTGAEVYACDDQGVVTIEVSASKKPVVAAGFTPEQRVTCRKCGAEMSAAKGDTEDLCSECALAEKGKEPIKPAGLDETARKAKVRAAIEKLRAKRFADPGVQQAVKAARDQFLAGTLDLRLMAAYHPAVQAEVRGMLRDATLKLAASAFDKVETLDIGGGYTAKRGKKGEDDQAVKTVVLTDKDGKEVAEYPDAFGDDTVTIIKLFRQLHDITEADDKAAVTEEKGEGEESKKPKALPKTEPKKEKDDEKDAETKDLEAAQRWFEERLEVVRSIVAERVNKRYVVAQQGDIDSLLMKGMGLEASMNEALKMAVDREVLRLAAMPDTALLDIRASLGGLKPRPVQVETQVSNEGLTMVAGLQVYAEKVENEGLGIGAAFGSAFRRR